jgi:hypothetical protein
MKPISPKEQKVILKSLREQGVEIITNTMGWTFRFPDGSTSGMHKSHGDYRSRLNLRAEIRRAGLEWPFDPHRKKKGSRDS